MNIEMYVCTHKKFKYCLPKEYKILHVGAEEKEDIGYDKDCIGDNISIKNSNYCELTGLYWMWKNSNADIIGLSHYRRYFYENWFQAIINRPIGKKYITRNLRKYDIIVPIMFQDKEFVYNVYNRDHHIKDLMLARQILEEKYPEYVETFDFYINQNETYLYNMFCAKKELIDQYCSWLFDILFELEKHIDISNYDKYNKRIFGFISERLFNVWIKKNQLKVKTCSVYNIESDSMFGQAVRQPLHLWLNGIFKKSV